MRLSNNLTGKYINLRTAEPEDSEFILSLRLNKSLNKYLKSTDPSIENQKNWVKQKQEEEGDYHLIIELKDHKKVGVIAVYNIKNGIFELGRWIIQPHTPIYVTIESCYLAYNYAFNTLGLKTAENKTRKDNKSVLNFHLNYGSKKIKEDTLYIYLSYKEEDFNSKSSFFQKYKKSLCFN